MLTGHHWGGEDGQSAWIYLGIAIRMVEIMGLCHESPSQPGHLSMEEFVTAEERRRTAWTCFLMENLLSGGGSRKRILKAEDMRIQLPCENEQFILGIPVRCEMLNGPLSTGEPSMLGHTLRVAKLWGDVAEWACSSLPSNNEPWDSTSKFQNLAAELDDWEFKLPVRFKYSLSSVNAHHSLGQGQGFCYMHCIYLMSLMFLYRTYLPHLDLARRQESRTTSIARSSNNSFYGQPEWQKHANTRLSIVSATVCDMCLEINELGVDFQRGLVPWVGFTVYTAVGVMLYIYNFSTSFECASLCRMKERISAGCTLLTKMKMSWPMAGRWFEELQLMQKFYLAVLRNNDIPPAERSTIRDALVDYGALHHSPAAPQQQMSNNATPHNLDRNSPGRLSLSNLLNDCARPTQDFSQDGDLDLFESDIDSIINGEEILDVFQRFWTTFPGQIDSTVS